MAIEKRTVRINKLTIKDLQADYNNEMASLVKVKEEKKFHEIVRKANFILDKINTLRIKTENIKRGFPPNGFQDYAEKFRIIN